MEQAIYRRLLEASPYPVYCVSGPDLILTVANKAALKAWDKDESVIGLPFSAALPGITGENFLELIRNVMSSGQPFQVVADRVQSRIGAQLRTFYFDYTFQPLRQADGKVDAVVCFAMDVTETETLRLGEQEANEKFSAAAKELLASNDELTQPLKDESGIMFTADLVTEQVMARKKVEQAEQTLRLAIDAANLGSWFIEPDTMNLTYNSALAKIFGYNRSGQMTFDMAIGQVTESFRPQILAEIEQAIISGGDYDITYSQNRFDDGALIWLRSIGRVTRSGDGQTLFSGFVMDITEQKKDDQRKHDFIAMVSHELKTPLTSLSGYIQMIQLRMGNTSDPFTVNALETASKQIRKMTRLINGFLNLSRLESGKINLENSRFRLDELVQQSVDEVRHLHPVYHIDYERCEHEPLVYADYDKISNVLSNLLSNAIKYSPGSDRILVHCDIMENTARVYVKDFGIGISEEHQAKLFQRYFRVETNKAISGFGVGLYLSKEIIERHKGEIWVESEPQVGSTFYFTLPLTLR